MSVRVIRPAEWSEAEMVEVESDASDNYRAISEIEDWASGHGMLRTNENWLATVLSAEGKKVFRAICYRPTAEQIHLREGRIAARHDSLRRQAELR